MKKTLTTFILMMLLALVVAACSGEGESTNTNTNASSDNVEDTGERVNDESIGVYDDKIVFGAHVGVSGPVSLIASEFQNGWDAALHEINKEGIHGRKLELVIENDEYSPAKAVAAVRKLIDGEKVFAITGVGSPPVLTAAEYVMQSGVPYVFPLAGHYEKLNSIAGSEEMPYLLMSHPDYATQLYLLTKYVIEEKGIEKVAVLYQNDDVSIDMRLGVNTALAEAGLEVVAEEGFETNSTDFSAQIQKAKSAGAEAVVLATSLKQGSLIVEQADRLGYNPLFYGHTTFADNNFIELTGELSEGAIAANFLIPEDSDTPEMERFLTALEEVSPDAKPTFFTMYAYSTLMSFAKALEETGESPTREKLIEVFESWKDKETELMGTLTFSEGNYDGKQSIYPIEVKDGKWTRVGEDWLELPEDFEF